jgi:hypothetical protein
MVLPLNSAIRGDEHEKSSGKNKNTDKNKMINLIFRYIVLLSITED